MITEDYVSFEVAKLLKEKGFDSFCVCCYTPEGGNLKTIWDDTYGEVRPNDWNNLTQEIYDCIGLSSWFGYISAPTLQMAMKWLRKNHKIHVDIDYIDFLEHGEVWSAKIVDMVTFKETKIESTWNYYEEACEAAIKYCLENLIQ